MKLKKGVSLFFGISLLSCSLSSCSLLSKLSALPEIETLKINFSSTAMESSSKYPIIYNYAKSSITLTIDSDTDNNKDTIWAKDVSTISSNIKYEPEITGKTITYTRNNTKTLTINFSGQTTLNETSIKVSIESGAFEKANVKATNFNTINLKNIEGTFNILYNNGGNDVIKESYECSDPDLLSNITLISRKNPQGGEKKVDEATDSLLGPTVRYTERTFSVTDPRIVRMQNTPGSLTPVSGEITFKRYNDTESTCLIQFKNVTYTNSSPSSSSGNASFEFLYETVSESDRSAKYPDEVRITDQIFDNLYDEGTENKNKNVFFRILISQTKYTTTYGYSVDASELFVQDN